MDFIKLLKVKMFLNTVGIRGLDDFKKFIEGTLIIEPAAFETATRHLLSANQQPQIVSALLSLLESNLNWKQGINGKAVLDLINKYMEVDNEDQVKDKLVRLYQMAEEMSVDPDKFIDLVLSLIMAVPLVLSESNLAFQSTAKYDLWLAVATELHAKVRE